MKILNAILFIAMIIAAGATYALEANVRNKIQNIQKLKQEIITEHENIKLLKVEWSYLNTPQKLKHIAQKYIPIKAVEAKKIIREKDIENIFPLTDPFRPIYGKNKIQKNKNLYSLP